MGENVPGRDVRGSVPVNFMVCECSRRQFILPIGGDA